MTATERKTRLGLIFFLIYAVAYGAFVLLSAFAPDLMKRVWWDGVNGSILCGMGLIGGAFWLALLYCWLLREKA